jgi:hypothetical protein
MQLNIKLALDRIAKDYSEAKTFVKLPYELTLIKSNNIEWVKNFEEDIINDKYAPGPIQICDVPKGNHHIRPGAYLSITDAVYYTALAGEAYDAIHKSTVWARDRYDFSYALTGNADNVKWVSDSFNEWKNFRTRSLGKIKQGYEYVLVADISGFYENINIQTLSYDLKHVGVASNVADALSKCLNHWAQNHGKGLPQGYTASNILAKLYLNSVDLRLKDDNYVHYRYVDDIRIFCKSFVEAKHALITLTSLLRSRGLNLQTSKTKILLGKEATDYIEGVQPIIETILEELKQEKAKDASQAQRIEAEVKEELVVEVKEEAEVKEELVVEVKEEAEVKEEDTKIEEGVFVSFLKSLVLINDNPYGQAFETSDASNLEVVPQGHLYVNQLEQGKEFSDFELVISEAVPEAPPEAVEEQIASPLVSEVVNDVSDPETVDIAIIKHTFDSFFIKPAKAHFDKTLFRFLLKRLAKAKDNFAVEYCKTLFERHPEETTTLLKYFQNVKCVPDALEAIETFLLSENSIYHYQVYQIIEWMDYIEEPLPSDTIISFIRKLAFDNMKPYYLKSISRKFLVRFANVSDLEMLEKLCIDTRDDVEQAEMICVIQKMEKNRRNSTYARLNKGILNKSAVKYVKSIDSPL